MAHEIVNSLRKTFNSGITKSANFRREQLKSLLRLYEENAAKLLDALSKDLKKSKQEAILSEIGYIINDTKSMLNNLDNYMKKDKPDKTLMNVFDDVIIEKEPYGVVLIISPWNYPVQLIFAPLTGAIAAGNCCIIKPSELAPHTAELIEQLIPKYLDNDCYKVINGGINETQELLNEKFDYIFFTGSTSIGKIVYQNAAKYLTPVTLELGGKSPVYLDDTVDIEIAAQRILWGKCVNAGQTCIAPDYILCNKNVEKQFINISKKILSNWYGEKIKQNPDYPRIINKNHFNRIINLMKEQNIVIGGNYDIDELFIEPTIISDVKSNDPIMNEEIFGPLLPIYNVNTVIEAIDFINQHEKPLALYVFSNNKNTFDSIVSNTSSGGVCINDTLMHFSCETLPFGGVGNSGMGAYHGAYSFDTFTHKKGVLIKKANKLGETLQKARYPPYSDSKLNTLKLLTKKRSLPSQKVINNTLMFLLGAVVTLFSVTLCKCLYN